ncbi:MAG: L-threonylcarbamoyladenylate synthase [Bacteroidia bacterium]|nr:L-threonylcarbamoyladenylate synthase [Bacteroidia bacterium]MDW8332704.1 L-threonylcarbamoyladenylate synthase [Bacteroidia bacterium]
MGQLLRVNPLNPQPRLIRQVVDALQNDGVIVYPTDTVYALGCDIKSKKGLEKIAHIKGVSLQKAHFSCICENVGIISEFAVGVSTPVYKLMKRVLPGPYTFILNASKKIPHFFLTDKKTVGIRVVDHAIPTEIIKWLGNPLVTTSLRDEADGYPTDPELIYERYKKIVDYVIDGGAGGMIASTVVDCTGDSPVVVRKGLGPIEALGLD